MALYMTELCWVICHVEMFVLTFAVIYALGVKQEWLVWVTKNSSTSAYLAFWGFANGPFGCSVLVLRNALVLHDLPNMAALFIHISPVTLAWTLRWYAVEVQKAWPNIFNVLEDPSKPSNVKFLDIFLPSFYLYMVWWVAYLAQFYFFSRYRGLEHSKLDTVFHLHMRNIKPWAKFLKFDSSTPEKHARMMPFIKF